MKKIIFTFLIICACCAVNAQMSNNTLPPLDQSPMDMSYYPANYPVLKIQNKLTEPLVARVVYSRPQRNNRSIFGDLVKYKEVWRLGANEATEIEFFKDVTVGTKKVSKGRYTLYAIPDSAQWTMIINKDTDTWGAFKYDDKKDVIRVTVPVQTMAQPLEPFTMSFEKSGNGANLVVGWDMQLVKLPIMVR